MAQKHGNTHRVAVKKAEEGERVMALKDGSFGVLGTPGYNSQGEPVQYLRLAYGREIKVSAARTLGIINPWD
jgi:hypothetical protein